MLLKKDVVTGLKLRVSVQDGPDFVQGGLDGVYHFTNAHAAACSGKGP
jgi:hypothetical protein